MRGYQLRRVLRLMSLLEGKVERTLGQLRAKLNAAKRTVQRDLNAGSWTTSGGSSGWISLVFLSQIAPRD